MYYGDIIFSVHIVPLKDTPDTWQNIYNYVTNNVILIKPNYSYLQRYTNDVTILIFWQGFVISGDFLSFISSVISIINSDPCDYKFMADIKTGVTFQGWWTKNQ